MSQPQLLFQLPPLLPQPQQLNSRIRMMIHHQLLLPIPQLLLQHIIVTSRDYLSGEPLMFHGILPEEKCAGQEREEIWARPLTRQGGIIKIFVACYIFKRR